MKFTYLTLFPEIIESFFQNSIMKRAVENGLIDYTILQIRDFAQDGPYHACDDTTYGGGAGMLLKSGPLARALDSADAGQKFCIYPSPGGYPMQQKIAAALSRLGQLENNEFLSCLKNSANFLRDFNSQKISDKSLIQNKIDREIIFICGRYEGIDQRIVDEYVDLELSIGDYVLSSGELSSLCLTDSIYRLCDGVINQESLASESFSAALLEYPQYTRPEYSCGRRVPEILLSGHHENIRLWRLEQSVKRTLARRPELLQQALKAGDLDRETLKILQVLQQNDH
ncbi:tRNA (guanine(37)-N(1))-methyltransferase [Candidatus Haliotispira prima]|uniref:tRNA (guanine-N(1)-)-methyltransferase n=1 Tax=Candidatus Haliotispira prima TaxID=3034016 RepID=A0ABY8MJT7_9SPIO|nr:tRNA (guanine(37)-N(1))-methyltransferase [Candidatus Haliotispira prima]